MESWEPWKRNCVRVRERYAEVLEGKRRVYYLLTPERRASLLHGYAWRANNWISRFGTQIERAFRFLDETLGVQELISFDVESIKSEQGNQILCLMALRLRRTSGEHPIQFEIHLGSLDGPPCPRRTQILERDFINWVLSSSSYSKTLICSHGEQESENRIRDQLMSSHPSRVLFINTVPCLSDLLSLSLPEDDDSSSDHHQHQKLHLGRVEELLEVKTRFQRASCCFIKHSRQVADGRTAVSIFPKEARLSLWDLASGEPLAACALCGKPQDLYLYCLEDCFASLLILILCLSVDLNDQPKKNWTD